jgi:hypothetical protein
MAGFPTVSEDSVSVAKAAPKGRFVSVSISQRFDLGRNNWIRTSDPFGGDPVATLADMGNNHRYGRHRKPLRLNA